MIYRANPRNQEQLSILGYGCLRFSRKGTGIDQAKAEQEMKIALAHGVNYFDTAYTYGGSEVCLGKFLAKGYRDQVNIATKLPHYYIKKEEEIERYFREQLERLQTDHVEYYLMHMLNDIAAWERLQSLKITEWIADKKAQGQIQNIGFSFHGNTENFLKILEAYDWDFCQIQYNYMDREEQAGDRGYALAERLEIPMIVMEPIKGGLLGVLPEDLTAILQKANPNASTASWALRWVGTHKNVKIILSGMSNYQQVMDNLETFAKFQPISKEEEQLIEQVADTIKKRVKNGCTGCEYCMPCPFGVDIPRNFSIWNELAMYGNKERAQQRYQMTAQEKRADQCKQCGKCETVCPQGLQIRKDLKQAAAEMKEFCKE